MVVNKSLVDNWIVVTLTNVNPSANSTCNLFKTSSSDSQISAVCSGQVVPDYPSVDFPCPVQVRYDTPAGTVILTSPTLNDMDELLAYILSTSSTNGGSTCYYVETSPTVYSVYFYSAYFSLKDLRPTSGSNFSTDLNQNVILGSFVNIDVESSDITYDELCSELQTQPYLLNWVSVYANTLNQANVRFSMDNKENTGKLYQDYQHPALSPMAKQFVNLGIPINFSPSSTHVMSYEVRAGESVKLIFGYTNKELLTIPEKTVFVPKTEIQNIADIIIVHKTDEVPLIAVVKKAMYNPNGNFLKKIIRPFVKDRIINKTEVYSAFIGTDFKELG